jgi:uncharacterized protein (UPF0333 family)
VFKSSKQGQSILEYSIMLAVVIAVLLIMQSFVKRGYQGSLKSSSDKMGEQFSAGGTTIKEEITMKDHQIINTEAATNTDINSMSPITAQGTLDDGVYSFTNRSVVDIVSTTQAKTDSASKERVRLDDYNDVDSGVITDFPDPLVSDIPGD